MAMGLYFYELAVEKRKNPADDMLLAAGPGHRRPGRRHRDRPRRRRDRRLRHPHRRGRCRDGHQAGRQRGRAVRPPTATSGRRCSTTADKIPGAVEEILRYLPALAVPGPLLDRGPRVRRRHASPPGFPVLLLTGAATRDPRAFERADDFDIERPPAVSLGLRPRHPQLPRRGAGPGREPHRHRRAGHDRYPNFEIDEAGLRRVHMSNVAGYSHVPVRAGT